MDLNKFNHPPVTGEPWDLWTDNCRSPGLNMGIDEALLQHAPDRNRPLLRFYGWDRPSVSIGYIQRCDAAPATGYTVVRRPTGGGVVFHDCDLTYTVVIPPGHWLTSTVREESYGWVNEALRVGLARENIDATLTGESIARGVSRERMVCFRHPTRYDLMLSDRKISGAAQRRRYGGILHQGSLQFAADLPVPRDRLELAVCAGFCQVLGACFETFNPDTGLLRAADRLAAERYESDAWNRRR